MTQYRDENERMLAAILGVQQEDAAEQLKQRVAITAADTIPAEALSRELREQLERTIYIVNPDERPDLEIVVGGDATGCAARVLFVSTDEHCLTVGAQGPSSIEELDGLRRTFAGCYAASRVLFILLDLHRANIGPAPEPYVIKYRDIGIPGDIFDRVIEFDDVALAGAGAVGNGLLRALRHLPTKGTLSIVDPKKQGKGNANRCLYFLEDDRDAFKAELLATRAQPDFPTLDLVSQVKTFAEFVQERGRVKRVLVATDSRRVRRSIQDDMPLEVVDASTTDIREIIVHSHRQLTSGACLACIYRHIPEEHAREKEIARGLGISLEDVAAGLVSRKIAEKIVNAHPDLNSESIVGMAFDSLFKQRCAEERLPVGDGVQVLAPFAFVSNLAGAYLAVELARLIRDAEDQDRTNYFFLSPWSAPNPRARRSRARDAECSFCSRPQAIITLKSLWADHLVL